MSQVDVSTSIGYALKRVTWALRSAMDARLREFDLSVSQYASLELLVHRPGISNAELARRVFVTRQATHQLLAGLKEAGLVEVTGSGRDQRLSVTTVGARKLTEASRAIAVIERRMLAGLSEADQDALRASLDACTDALAASGSDDSRTAPTSETAEPRGRIDVRPRGSAVRVRSADQTGSPKSGISSCLPSCSADWCATIPGSV